MSSIHYKLRATLEYRTLQFDGLSISAAELKREICSKENIRAEAFELLLTNAHTKRSYTGDDLIPRNSSIIVQRVPREDAEKLPKIQNVNMGMVSKSEASSVSGLISGHISTPDFEKMTEEERLAHIKHVSTATYHSNQYHKKPSSILSGPPPPTYTCNRCYNPGHWFKNCPMLNTKRTTGIPSQELMPTTADDPLAMLHPSGKHVIPIMHWMARQHKKNVEETSVTERAIPAEFTCPLCENVLKDAVLTTCCGNSFCAECLSQSLLESEDRHCPGEKCTQTQLALDAIVPNRMVRQAVQNWQSAGSSSAEAQEAKRIRIGLQPTTSVPSTASPPLTAPPSAVDNTGTSLEASAAVAASASTSDPLVQPPLLPAVFSQPPPNLASMAIGQSLGPVAGMAPVSEAAPTAQQSGLAEYTPLPLPPIPGVGLQMPPVMAQPVFNRPPPQAAVPSGPQFLDIWNSFLNRNEKQRPPRKKKRSRSRSSSSSSSSSSHGERSRRRVEKESRRGSRRRPEGADDRYEERRQRDHRERHSATTRSTNQRERRPGHNYSRTREPQRYQSSVRTDDRDRREERKRKDRRERAVGERSERRKRKMDDSRVSGQEDDEAAIDDALKEAERLEAMDSVSDKDSTLLDNGDAENQDVDDVQTQPERSEKGGDVSESSQPQSSHMDGENGRTSEAENESPAQAASLSQSPQPCEEEMKTTEEVVEAKESVSESPKKKSKKHKKHHKHKHERTDEERSSHHKEKKRKKHKKEKKSKKEKDAEDESDRRERRREKKEKKTRRSKDRDGEQISERVEKVESKCEETKEKVVEDKPRLPERIQKDDSVTVSSRDKKPRNNPPTASKEAKTDLEEEKVKIVVNEKQIRESFSPPQSMLKSQKITLNL